MNYDNSKEQTQVKMTNNKNGVFHENVSQDYYSLISQTTTF